MSVQIFVRAKDHLPGLEYRPLRRHMRTEGRSVCPRGVGVTTIIRFLVFEIRPCCPFGGRPVVLVMLTTQFRAAAGPREHV